MKPTERARRASSRSALTLILLALAAGGCHAYSGADRTAVGSGHYYSTANPDYDEFFLRLYRLQVELGEAPVALSKNRSAVCAWVAIPESADDATLKKALTERSTQLRSRGVVVQVDRGRGADAAPSLSVSGPKQGGDADLVGALETALRFAGSLRVKLGDWQKALDELPPRGIELETKLESAFVGQSPGLREEARANLADAQKMMALMAPRLKELDAQSSALVATFASAFGEVSHAAPPPPPPEPEEPEPKPKAKPGRAARPGTKPRPPAPAARSPSSPPPPANRDEPPPAAPKPPPGNAKPDFEP